MPSLRRKATKLPAAPLDLDEIERDPGFRGMLSFLEIPPQEKARQLALRDQATAQSPMGDLPAGTVVLMPEGQSPTGVLEEAPLIEADTLRYGSERPVGDSPIGESHGIAERPMDYLPMGQSPTGQLPQGNYAFRTVPYMDIEGRGKRPLRYCKTVQDGHTSGEQLAYQSLWQYARRFGSSQPDGSCLVEIGLARICDLLSSDHKNVKRLLGSLEQKLAIEVVRPPNYKLAIPTQYRIFSYSQILERRKGAGLVWVIRTRTIRFVGIERVNQLLSESITGQPAGESPTGRWPRTNGFPATLARDLSESITLDANSVQQLWEACQKGTPDCTEEEVLAFCRTKLALIQAVRIDNPAGLLLRSVPKFFEDGGSMALKEYRDEHFKAQERERQRLRRSAELILVDPDITDEERTWARDILLR